MTAPPPFPDSDPVVAIDSLLDRLVSVLSGAGARPGPATTGAAEDDAIMVTVGPDGRVQDIGIDARMLRRPDVVGAGIAAAANEAMRARPPAESAHRSLVEDLRAIQEDSLTVTKQINTSLVATLDQLKRS